MNPRSRWALIGFVILMFTLVGAAVCSAQAVPAAKAPATTIMIDATVGGGFGTIPIAEVGAGIEKVVSKRMELQSAFEYTPPVGNILGPAKPGFVANGNGLIWVKPRLAFYGSLRFSAEYFDGISKHATYLQTGVVIRDRWNTEMPGRLYVSYEQELGGCVWATPSNPCPLTSSQLKGATLEQEFRMTNHLRFSAIMGVYIVGNQVNPNAPQAGQSHSLATEGLFRLRYVIGKQGNGAY